MSVVLLLVIVIVLIVLLKRRKSSKPEQAGTEGNSYPNAVYELGKYSCILHNNRKIIHSQVQLDTCEKITIDNSVEYHYDACI